jgi:hypothetical protein
MAVPDTSPSVLEAEASDSFATGTGARSLDVFDDTDMLNRWAITTAGTQTLEVGVPAIKYALAGGQSLAMEGRVGSFTTAARREAVYQFRLRVDASTPKVMVGLMASGSTEASVADGVWLEKAASGTALKLKGRYNTGTVVEGTISRVWPTAGFVDVAIKLMCWPGGLEAVIELDGAKEAQILVSGLETGRTLVPCLFVTAQSNVWLSQAALRCS